MAGTYECPRCKSRTDVDEGDAPLCVPCKETMVLVGATLASEPTQDDTPAAPPLAPENIDAYKAGLKEIEAAKDAADQQEREYLRATVKAVADRLRPRPLFEDPDHHSTEELVALLAGAGVQVTAEAVRRWTDTERADARAYALAAHSEQPRLIPPFLWSGSPEDDGAAVTGTDSDTAADQMPSPGDGDVGASVDANDLCVHDVSMSQPCAQCDAEAETSSAE